ncbi:MAG: 16S rRNA (cytosine(1402)-N(4))-methyltransferase RsmH [Candidatus Dojkabacteria bacterium]
MQKYHIPVFLNEALHYLNIKPDGQYIDCTLGEGGHSYEIYKKLTNGKLLSIDQDSSALAFVKEYYKEVFVEGASSEKAKPEWILYNSNFAKLDQACKANQLNPDGILMDLGLSSRQLEQYRGFSYREQEAPLDMRMDESLTVKAQDLLKVLTEGELTMLFQKYGEERFARQIAKQIKASRYEITTVGELNQLILRAVPAALRQNEKNPSKRVFQALRIAVNDELNSLKTAISKALTLLNPQGRLVIITFHSLEDSIVKDAFAQAESTGGFKVLTEKPIMPSEEELKQNSRAHSAKLRAIEHPANL